MLLCDTGVLLAAGNVKDQAQHVSEAAAWQRGLRGRLNVCHHLVLDKQVCHQVYLVGATGFEPAAPRL